MRAWTGLTDSLADQGEAAEKAGHRRTAGRLFARATNYPVNAERMQAAHSPERLATYQRCLDLMERSFALNDPLTTRVEIPYEGTFLPAYFTRTPAADRAPAPVVILWNGPDSTKEHQYLSGFSHELAARGISTLMVDCPGSGEALRMRDLTARIDTEAWAAACVDCLEARDDVRADRIGLADKGHAGAGHHVKTPYKGRNKPESQKAANRSHAKLRGPGERANAQLNTWKTLTRLRCRPHRAGHLAKAVHVLQNREAGAY